MTLYKKFKILLVIVGIFILSIISLNFFHEYLNNQYARFTREVSNVLETHVLADMHHDAIHSDVLLKTTNSPHFELKGFNENIENFQKKIKSNLEARFSDSIHADFLKAEIKIKEYCQLATQIINRSSSAQNIEQLFEKFSICFTELADLNENITENIKEFRESLYRQIDRTNDIFNIIKILFFLLSLILLFLMQKFLRISIMKPIQSITQDIGGLAKGNLHLQIQEVHRTDEIGDMARALDIIKKTGIESVQLRTGLDAISGGILIIDPTYTIIYHNKSFLNILSRHHKVFNISLKKNQSLLGEEVNFLTSQECLQEKFLLNSIVMQQFSQPSCTLEVISSPIFNEYQDYLGAVIEIIDITDEVAVQNEIAQIIQFAANGDLSIRIDTENKNGHHKEVAHSLNQLMQNTEAAIKEVGNTLSAIATGNLNVQITKQYSGLFKQLSDDTNTTIFNLNEILKNIRLTAESIYDAIAKISSDTIELSKRTEFQASGLEETAASMAILAQTVVQNSSHSEEATKQALDSLELSENGGALAIKSKNTMTKVSTSSSEIANIISVIDEIVSQTDLLALNAAVEAARAGETGKGFSVVAENVSKLAHRSSIASQQIKDIILTSKNHVGAGVESVQQVAESLQKIHESSQKVTEYIKQIANSSQEQSIGIREINDAIRSMDHMTQKNAIMVQESLSTTQTLQQNADELSSLISAFQLKI